MDINHLNNELKLTIENTQELYTAALEMKGIHSLEQLYRLKWLISDGAWILKNLKKVTA